MESVVACVAKGRPREFDVDAALAEALRVFWSKGYEGTSLTDLTEAMGITRPSLYAAFGNKESLFRKALDLYEREKLAYVGEALKAPTAREVAERLLWGSLGIYCSECEPRGCLRVINSVACGVEAESIRAEVLARRASSHRAIIDRFVRAKAEGDLPPETDPEALADYLGAVIQGISLQAGAGATREQLDAVAKTCLAMWPSR